ncbi:MAG: hypothetical protein Q8R53_05605 [Nanoarchaeota archaeon]|nr:hypothetical protein [Nanoarchaeota archaeon]
MVSPQFIEEKPLSLVEVHSALEAIEKRDTELNFLSNKTKEYVTTFVRLTAEQQEQLEKKLHGLELTRLKTEHIKKILDFVPTTVNELKIVLQAYPLTMPKKDQESIVTAVNDVLKEQKAAAT